MKFFLDCCFRPSKNKNKNKHKQKYQHKHQQKDHSVVECLEDCMEEVVHNLLLPCMVVNSKGTIIQANESVYKLFGYDELSFLNTQINKYIVGIDIATPSEKKYKGLHKDGSVLDVHISLSHFNNHNIFTIIQDISYLIGLERIRKSMDKTLPQEMLDTITNYDRTYPRNARFNKNNNVYILFCDIVGFSVFCMKNPPQMVGDMIHTVFSKIDENIEKYGLEKIRTVGDGYIITSGVINPHSFHQYHMKKQR